MLEVIGAAVVGVVIGLVLDAIVVIIVASFINDRLQDLIETFIEKAYEPAAYKAAKELTESGEMGNDCGWWTRIWKPIMKLRWLWPDSVRNRLEKVHYSHHDRFPFVEFEVDWKDGFVHISIGQWVVVLLDERQQELDRIGAKTEAEAYSIGRSALAQPHRYVRHDRSPKAFLVLDPNGKVVGPEESVETEPRRSGAEGN